MVQDHFLKFMGHILIDAMLMLLLCVLINVQSKKKKMWAHQCPWKVIAQVFSSFCHFTLCLVDNGTKFAFGRIFGGVPFCIWLPNLYRVVRARNSCGSSISILFSSSLWNFNCLHNLTNDEINELNNVDFSPCVFIAHIVRYESLVFDIL